MLETTSQLGFSLVLVKGSLSLERPGGREDVWVDWPHVRVMSAGSVRRMIAHK